MSFSLKYLFAIVAIAAIFTAALLYRTPFWTLAAVNVTVVVLLTATVGVSVGRLNRAFWGPVCLVGWFYYFLSFTPYSINRASHYVPSKAVVSILTPSEYLPALDYHSINHSEEIDAHTSFGGPLYGRFEEMEMNYVIVLEFRRFADIVDALFALIAGGIAGVIASFLLRHKPEH